MKNNFKQNEEMTIEKENFIDIFLDNGANQLEENFFLNKKRMLNAQKGKNELFEMLQLKLKGLDMLSLILTNNKNLKESDIQIDIKTLTNLLQISKSDKSLYQPIIKKIKSISCSLLKSQLNSGKIDPSLINFILHLLLEINYENSYFQQVTNIISQNKNGINSFIDELFNKLFKGRNISIKFQDIKFIIKYLLSSNYTNYFELSYKLINNLRGKNYGGARTYHQKNQIFVLLNYIVDLLLSKDKTNELTIENFNKFYKFILDVLKENFEDSKKIDKEDKEKFSKEKTLFSEFNKYINKLENILEKNKEKVNIFEDKDFIKNKNEISNLYKEINAFFSIESGKKERSNKKDKKSNVQIKEEEKQHQEKKEEKEDN